MPCAAVLPQLCSCWKRVRLQMLFDGAGCCCRMHYPQFGHTATVARLLEAGADVHAVTTDGEMAFHVACEVPLQHPTAPNNIGQHLASDIQRHPTTSNDIQ